jgi:hypothetical protein
MGKNSRKRAERKGIARPAGRVFARQRLAALPALLIVWGMPGSGKSAYSQWTSREMGSAHVDTDALINRQPHERTRLEQGWYATFTRQMTPAAFMSLARSHGRPVVVEFGLWANADNIRLLADLHNVGAELAWFEGDRLAAKDSWLRENQARGRYLPDGLWDDVVAMMDTNRQLLIQVFGLPRMLRTVESGPVHALAETIHAAIFRAGREAA